MDKDLKALREKVKEYQEKEDKIFELCSKLADIDGSHHKQWALIEIMKIIKGSEFDEWLKAWEIDEDGEYIELDKGVAP